MRLKIQDLFYLYKKSGTTTVALRGLNLVVEPGECLVINGPNGSGKSTLIKILTGFLEASAGQIFFDEEEIHEISTQRLRGTFLSSIDQKGLLLEDFTMCEYLSLSRALTGVSLPEADRWAEETLEHFGLGHISKMYPRSISGGERQICSLLAAIATDPKILIADEPSGDLDDEASARLFSALSLLSGKTTVLIVSHDARAEVIADRVVRIHKGRIGETWIPGQKENSVPDPFGWVRIPTSKKISPRPSQVNRADKSVLLAVQEIGLTLNSRILFSDLSFSAGSGELVLVTGKSGSGRSSFLRILAGLQLPTSGSVTIQDHILGKLSGSELSTLLAETIGFLGQGDGPIERLLLQDHLKTNCAEVSSDFAIRMKEPLSAFSGGERARIELMKVFSMKKPLLLLDEPTSSLDEERAQEIFDLIFDFVNEGGLAIVSSREEVLLQNAHQILDLSHSPRENK